MNFIFVTGDAKHSSSGLNFQEGYDMGSEAAAQKAIREALAALNRAVDATEEAGYGSLVLSSLEEACVSVSYASDVAEGRV